MDERLHTRILGQVESRREDIVRFLQDLIRIPSLPGEEGRGQSFIGQKLRDREWMLMFGSPTWANLEKIHGS